MEPALPSPKMPIRWLAAANVVWLLAGVLAYATSVSLVVGTALALVPTLPGLLELRRNPVDAARSQWVDRAMSFAIAGWAMLAVMILLPYIASENGLSLWASRGFASLGIATASVAMLLWNAAAYMGLAAANDLKAIRLYAGFHVALLAVALFYAASEMDTTTILLRGQEIVMPDLKMAAGIAAAPSVLWALVFWRIQQD